MKRAVVIWDLVDSSFRFSGHVCIFRAINTAESTFFLKPSHDSEQGTTELFTSSPHQLC